MVGSVLFCPFLLFFFLFIWLDCLVKRCENGSGNVYTSAPRTRVTRSSTSHTLYIEDMILEHLNPVGLNKINIWTAGASSLLFTFLSVTRGILFYPNIGRHKYNGYITCKCMAFFIIIIIHNTTTLSMLLCTIHIIVGRMSFI